jgi:hypothetical protein
MDDLTQFESGLRRVLWELKPYLPELVVIGGWVPHLYRRYGGFTEWKSALSRTGEVDVLVTRAIDAAGRPSIPAILEAAGFRPVGDSGPAAVWAKDPARGEMIEFLVPHVGTAKQLGGVQPLPSQPGLGALSLTDLTLLQAHTTTLDVPVTVAVAPPRTLAVRVPTLGAYAVTKAATFPKRSPIAGAAGVVTSNPKRAKDVLYLRDLMAAGDEVVARIEEDAQRIRRSSKPDREYVHYAANNLSLLFGREPTADVKAVTAMLAERDGVSVADATADVIGHLTDLREVLEGDKA